MRLPLQKFGDIRASTGYRALIGAKTTGVSRYYEYMDGTYMYDGTFADSESTPIGSALYGKFFFRFFFLPRAFLYNHCSSGSLNVLHFLTISGMNVDPCVMIDDTGVVKQCTNGKASILCEMHLAPIDRQLCLDKTIASSSITFNTSTEIVVPSASVR